MFLLNYNKYFLSAIVLLIYIIINFSISNMTLTGVGVNLVGIIIIFALIYTKRIELMFLFFILNTILGPYLIVNFSLINLDTLGRLDYFIANSLMIYIILKQYKYTSFILIILTLIFFSILYNFENMTESIAIIYGYISRISMGYLFYYFWVNKSIFNRKYILQILFYLLILHFILSIIQFIYPLYLRSSSIEADLIVLGHIIHRPLGLLGASYVYGVTTLFLMFFYYHYKSCITQLDKIFIILFIILAAVSSRTVFIAVLLYAVFIEYVKLTKVKKMIFMIFLFVILAFVISTQYQKVFLNQSNSTKILLWYLAIKDIIFNSSMLQIIFGHGIQSSLLLSNQLPDFVSDLLFQVKYDNRIDITEVGFPIHNIFIQILYENGLIVFLFLNFYIVKIIKNIIKYKVIGLEVFLFFMIVVNFSLHNGIYSSMLIFTILVMLNKIEERKNDINNRINI